MNGVCERAITAIAKGEFQTPSIANVRRYLKSIGAVCLGSGKGDHEKWRLRNGMVIVLNAAKGQRKELDFGSLKNLASALNVNIESMCLAIKSTR